MGGEDGRRGWKDSVEDGFKSGGRVLQSTSMPEQNFAGCVELSSLCRESTTITHSSACLL
jgi:hypothetical protein